MTALPNILNPLGQYFGLDALGLTLGNLWFGAENEDPETSPTQVYWDSLGTEPASQPISVVDGYPRRDGTPAQLFISGAFSIRARMKSATDNPSDGVLIFYLPSVANVVSTSTPGAWPMPIAFTQPTDTSPAANAWLGSYDVRWAAQLPANLGATTPAAGTGGGYAFDAPTGSAWTMTGRLNSTGEDHTTGTAICTLTWADGSHTPTLATTGGVTIDLPAGSRIDWYADSVDTTAINGLYWTVIAYVQGDGTGAYANLVTEAELTAAVADLQSQIDTLTASIGALQGYQVGDVKVFAGLAADLPAHWLPMDSDSVQVLAIADHPTLGALLSNTWGGDGSATFGIPPARYFRGANGTVTVGQLLDAQLETHNHATGLSFTLGSTVPAVYGTTDAGISTAPHQTVHTDNNAAVIQTYTSSGSVAPGTGTGTEVGTFGSETRPITAVFTFAIYAGPS